MELRERIADFVGRRTWAVVGASNDHEKYGNRVYRVLRERGYHVYPVHPTITQVEGDQAYADVTRAASGCGGAGYRHPTATRAARARCGKGGGNHARLAATGRGIGRSARVRGGIGSGGHRGWPMRDGQCAPLAGREQPPRKLGSALSLPRVTLTGLRLTLRPLEDADLVHGYRWERDREVQHWAQGDRAPDDLHF